MEMEMEGIPRASTSVETDKRGIRNPLYARMEWNTRNNQSPLEKSNLDGNGKGNMHCAGNNGIGEIPENKALGIFRP